VKTFRVTLYFHVSGYEMGAVDVKAEDEAAAVRKAVDLAERGQVAFEGPYGLEGDGDGYQAEDVQEVRAPGRGRSLRRR
jgi:hypothetical protein